MKMQSLYKQTAHKKYYLRENFCGESRYSDKGQRFHKHGVRNEYAECKAEILRCGLLAARAENVLFIEMIIEHTAYHTGENIAVENSVEAREQSENSVENIKQRIVEQKAHE